MAAGSIPSSLLGIIPAIRPLPPLEPFLCRPTTQTASGTRHTTTPCHGYPASRQQPASLYQTITSTRPRTTSWTTTVGCSSSVE